MPVEYYDEKGEQLDKITFHAAYRVEIGKEGRCKLLKKSWSKFVFQDSEWE